MSHSYVQGAEASRPRLGLASALTLAFVVGEAVAGYLAHRLALMSDAGHTFSDALALIRSWYGLRAAMRPATSRSGLRFSPGRNPCRPRKRPDTGRHRGRHPLGSGRTLPRPAAGPERPDDLVGTRRRRPERLDKLLAPRFGEERPEYAKCFPPHAGGCRLRVRGGSRGAGRRPHGEPAGRPGGLAPHRGAIVGSSWGIITEAVTILLEAVPNGLDMAALGRSIKDIHGVLGVHDLHVWTVASGILAASCHVLVSEQSVRSGERILRAVAGKLRHDFGIGHTTIQGEVDGRDADEMDCTMRPTRDSHAGHEHQGYSVSSWGRSAGLVRLEDLNRTSTPISTPTSRAVSPPLRQTSATTSTGRHSRGGEGGGPSQGASSQSDQVTRAAGKTKAANRERARLLPVRRRFFPRRERGLPESSGEASVRRVLSRGASVPTSEPAHLVRAI